MTVTALPMNRRLLSIRRRHAVPLGVLAVVGMIAVAAPRTSASKPRLVVFVSVDQMRVDYLTRFATLYRGGFKRLLDEGAVFVNARYRHSNTETGPGHAALLSGRHADVNGIVANLWYDRAAGAAVNVVDDPAQMPIPGPGRGASPFHFLSETIGDLAKKANPAVKVVGVSVKDRAAILMAGRRADAAYWYETATGGFGTSTYYARELPAWLAAWNAGGHVDGLAGKAWSRALLDESTYTRLAGPDDVVGEGKPRVFPHVLPSAPASKELRAAVLFTPWADELILDVSLEAVKAHDLGTDDATDILAVGFSTTDFIGHMYGPDSHEVMDQMLRLDLVLGRLFDAAEARAGRGHVLLGLSSDHGVLPLVEVLAKKGVTATRVVPSVLEGAVKDALKRRFGSADAILAHYADPNFYLDFEGLARRGLARADVEATIEQALLATGVVERVYTQEQLLGPIPPDDPERALFKASFFQPRSPDVIVRLKPNVYADGYATGTSHGTVHDYDRHVPVAFLGASIRPGRFDAACGPEDIAPTLAKILGLPYRLEASQRVLGEALARPGAE